MKILVDENIGRSIVEYLGAEGHDVVWIKELRPGMADEEIIKLALEKKRVLITYDQDFGELVFKRGAGHKGVLLIRLHTDNVIYHLRALKNFLSCRSSKEITGRFWKIDEEYLKRPRP